MRRRRLVSGVVLVFSWGVLVVAVAVDPLSGAGVLIVAVVSGVAVVVVVCGEVGGVVLLWFMSDIEPVVSVVAVVPVCWPVGALGALSVVLAVVSVAAFVVAMLLVMPVLTVPLKVLPGAVLPVRFVVSAEAQPHSIVEKTATAMRDGVVEILILSFNFPCFLVLRVAERKIAAAAATPFKTGTYPTADVATA